jgi:hypothetical protein
MHSQFIHFMQMMKPKLINSYNISSAISRPRCVQVVIIDSGFIKKIVNIVYDWGKAFLVKDMSIDVRNTG